MATKPSPTRMLEQGRKRVEAALKTLDRDFQRLQKQADSRRREFERRATAEVKRIQKELAKAQVMQRAQKQARELERRADELREELRASDAYERAESFRKEAADAWSQGIDTLLQNLRIASASDFAALDRKIGRLNQKLADLQKANKPPRKRTRKSADAKAAGGAAAPRKNAARKRA